MQIIPENLKETELREFLNSYFSSIKKTITEKDLYIYECINQGLSFPVIVNEKVEETDYSTVWFNSENLPWKTMKDLADIYSKSYSCKVRYEKEDSSDFFYETQNGQTKEINWI